MSFWVINVPGTPMSNRTFADLKREVAGVVAHQGDPNMVGAGEAIATCMREWNSQRWDYLTVRGSDIPLYDHRTRVDGQAGYRGRYQLPTRIRDLVSMKVRFDASASGGTPLRVIPRGAWDRMVSDKSGGGTRYVTNFEFGTTGWVELLDAPEMAGTGEIRYWRMMVIPSDDAQKIDLPADGPLEAAVTYKAKGIVALDKGSYAKAKYYFEMAEGAYRRALGTDRQLYLESPDWRQDHEEHGLFPERQKTYDSWGTWGDG